MALRGMARGGAVVFNGRGLVSSDARGGRDRTGAWSRSGASQRDGAIMNYDWDFAAFYPYRWALLRGVWVTIELSFVSSLIGTIVGFPLGILYRLKPLDRALLLVNDAIRAVPPLVLIFFFYYFPYQQIVGVKPPSEFVCAAAALTLAQAVYVADIVRAAVAGVAKGPILGARSLGLTEVAVWRHIILPDVFRQVSPSLVAFVIGNVRLSSLASVIGCQDVVFVAKVAISQRFRSLEAWIIVAAVYVVLVLPLTLLSRRLEASEWLKRR